MKYYELLKDLKTRIRRAQMRFSERNLNRMLAFYRGYRESSILPPAVAKLDNPLMDNNILRTSLSQMRFIIDSTAIQKLNESL